MKNKNFVSTLDPFEDKMEKKKKKETMRIGIENNNNKKERKPLPFFFFFHNLEAPHSAQTLHLEKAVEEI